MTSIAFKKKISLTLLATAFMLFASGFVFAPGAYAATTAAAATGFDLNLSLVCFSAALAFGMGALAAGISIGKIGSAAMGAISERPEIASQALIFIALAEGLVIFGFITALMILGKA
ncbi:ATP synthase subunit C [Sphaerochaeta pleomorpha str. Grapes]|uniref:ATP synthase subunit C n=1 Tax=Sphaerochaeta pleomorpha (strain ATCC BAA-1885 / DSM 22778 / Grapes) TaxID=158190 RepID=G8QYL4_SPHPG|nr:ATP synthase subunit C [Sphaerochaeta pleomorpha]AEV28577.1 ATP synthase subunit C [Sphaerochaeta pleomorpha str. Grapes]